MDGLGARRAERRSRRESGLGIAVDLGGSNFGHRFETVFIQFVKLQKPGQSPKALWEELLDSFGQMYPEMDGERLSLAAMQWFLAMASQLGMIPGVSSPSQRSAIL
jgi:hypothetical protein